MERNSEKCSGQMASEQDSGSNGLGLIPDRGLLCRVVVWGKTLTGTLSMVPANCWSKLTEYSGVIIPLAAFCHGNRSLAQRAISQLSLEGFTARYSESRSKVYIHYI